MDTDKKKDRSTFTICTRSVIASILAAAAVGFAIHQHGGEYTAVAIGLVSFALIASIFAVIWSTRVSTEGRSARWIDYTIVAALLGQFIALLILWPVGEDQAQAFRATFNRQLYFCETAISGLLVLLSFIKLPAIRRWWFPGLLLFHALLGFWTVRSSPQPHIDVWYFQQMGATALLNHRNPYDAKTIRFPDIYHSTRRGHQQVYGEGLVANDHLTFGFPYLPLSLYCSTLGYVLGTDIRYAQVLALMVAGLLMGYCRPGRLPKLAAALLMFTPTVWFILGRAWTEPLVVMFLAATVFCACRSLRWLLPVALGLLLASKQYLAFVVPLSFLLLPSFDWRSKRSWLSWMGLLAGAFFTAAVVTLPLAVLDFRAFWFSAVTVQEKAPFRWDALSYLVWAGFHIDSRYTRWSWLAFAAVIPALLLSLWKARRNPAGFAGAMALVYLVFIAFNKQAFCNYYFFVIGCFCCAIAASANAPPALYDRPGREIQQDEPTV